jgi:phosphatidylglycerophosphatase C
MDLALFDFDGTVTERDCFTDFLQGAAPPLRRVLGTVVLTPLLVGYRAGLLPVSTLRAAVVRVALSGVHCELVNVRGRDFAAREIPGRVRQWSHDRIEWHLQRGDVVALVSASLDVYLRPWCEARGIDLICNELERRGEHFTGRCVGGDCGHEEKRSRVLARYRIEEFGAVYAYGDTPDDFPMLSLADHAFYRGKPWRSAS